MSCWYERAAVIPGRSSVRSKSPQRLRMAWALAGSGACLMDAESRSYIDLVCGLGAISLGYGRGEERWDGWTAGVFSLPHQAEVEAAEAVLQHVAPWASHVRFLKTGSEATHAAYRIAKQATGRPHVLQMAGSYHGWHEWCSDGHRLTFPYLYEFQQERGDDIAAVFIEPLRFEPMDVEWLQRVRAFCTRIGALLVFDSMIYGGRMALGGASEYFGITPDVECFGKAFGNGEAVAFVVGRDALRDHGEIASGTFSGDATGCAAVCDVLRVYTTEPVIETLWNRGRQLQNGLRDVLPGVTVDGCPPLTRFQFPNPEHGMAFCEAMAERGVLLCRNAEKPDGPIWAMTMFGHTEDHINYVIEAAEACACRSQI